MKIAVSLDVPSLEAGIGFYAALGFAPAGSPGPGMMTLACGDARFLMLERAPGSAPVPGLAIRRDYGAHWTPVHLDFHVDAPEVIRARAEAAGATCEAWHDLPGFPQVAMMRDPFGHGFCLIGPRRAAGQRPAG